MKAFSVHELYFDGLPGVGEGGFVAGGLLLEFLELGRLVSDDAVT